MNKALYLKLYKIGINEGRNEDNISRKCLWNLHNKNSRVTDKHKARVGPTCMFACIDE